VRFDMEATAIQRWIPPKIPRSGSGYEPLMKSAGWDELDGTYEARHTTIRPDHLRLVVFGVGSATARMTSPAAFLLTAVQEVAALGSPGAILADQKLMLGIQFYTSSHFEVSAAASFLWRFTTLEIL